MKVARGVGLAVLIAGVGMGAWAATKAWAAHCGGAGLPSCTEDIRNTKHNLASNTDILSTGTTEVCVFCHTPHGGRADVAGGGAPLWNRALPPTGGFTNYSSPNFDNDQGAETVGPKGVSLACLSCHDGVIALDALINAGGSGGFQPANRATLGGTSAGTSLGLTFNGGCVDSTKSLKEGDRPAGPGGYNGGLNDFVGGCATGGMEPFPNLTRDLTDDHPISMRMPAADPQFVEALAGSSTVLGNIRPVKRGASYQLPTDKRDMVRLYNSGSVTTGGTTATSVDWVECASCHNPHTPRTTFLRLPTTPSDLAAPGNGNAVTPYTGTGGRDLNHEPNQGSLICLTCHQK